MESIEGKNRKSVPQFGGWDRKTGGETNYSMVFSQARETRKKYKDDGVRHSLGNERELLNKQHQDDDPSSKKMKKNKSAYLCCFMA